MSKKLRERNQEIQKKVMLESQEIKKFRTEMVARYGIDPLVESDKFPVTNPNFSWTKFQTKLRESVKLNEADAQSANAQFLRAGVQAITNNLYETTETTEDDWVTTVASTKDTELYAPLHGLGFPRQVGPSEVYSETGTLALDIKLKNLKFGYVYPIERELLEDDQTGQFQQQSGRMGEYMKILQEVWCYGKLQSVASMQYQQLSIPTSETKPSEESNYPYTSSANPFVGGGFNRPVAFGALSQSKIQDGMVALMQQKNKQSLIMGVKPSRLLISPQYRFDAAVLLNSAYYPSGAAAAGSTGGAFAINPIQGLLDLTVARYLFDHNGLSGNNSKAWFLLDDSKPWFIKQLREAVSVEMENPGSGDSFNKDIHRFKARSRFNADFIDPRFVWKGSDGSV